MPEQLKLPFRKPHKWRSDYPWDRVSKTEQYTPEQIEAARERTDGFLAAWASDYQQRNDIGVLLRSCYLQGAWDAAQVAALMRIERTEGSYEETR